MLLDMLMTSQSSANIIFHRSHRVDKTHRTADLRNGDVYITAQGHNPDVRYSWTLSEGRIAGTEAGRTAFRDADYNV